MIAPLLLMFVALAGDDATGAASKAPADALDLTRVHALVVGVLRWASPGFASFSATDRQDLAFAQTLIAHGVPEGQVTVLLDDEATLARIETELSKTAECAGPGSTLVVYYAGHGTRAGEKGCFANFDMTGADDGLTMDRIVAAVAGRFAGTRFLAFADCCHSGSLGAVVDALASEGIEGACVTSVVAESTSTGNWTFTQTLVEAFAGDASLDRDGDGFIDLGELDDAVGEAMSWREGQRSGVRFGGLAPRLRLVPAVASADVARGRAAAGDTATGTATPLAPGRHVTTKGKDATAIGRVVGLREDGRCVVRFYDYATHRDVAMDADDLSAAAAALAHDELKIDAVVGVRRGPDVLTARVRAIDRALCQVDFPEWPELPAEWTARRAVVLAPARPDGWRPCSVEWKGSWYPAAVLAADPPRHRVHYMGYGASWDEWVDPDRIRFAAVGASDVPSRGR